jgi:pimeloyl-ACP methyl ester carboxylesterase
MAADLRQLLDALAITGPLVLVGHSWGGATARRFIHDFPDEVVGLVLVDASHEKIKGMIPGRITRSLYTSTTVMLRLRPIRSRLLKTLGFGRLAPEVLTAMTDLPWFARGRTAQAEFAGTGPSLLELGRIAPDLPDLPTRVLLAGGKADLTAKLGARQMASIRAAWDSAVAGRSQVRLDVVPGSGHYISLDQPQAVIDAIDEVLDEVTA